MQQRSKHRYLARSLALKLPSENFQIAKIQKMPFADEQFDAVIICAVLHFAESQELFNRLLQEMWRVLKKDGLLFVRPASSIGIEDKTELINGRRFRLPDGSERFLVDEDLLIETSTAF